MKAYNRYMDKISVSSKLHHKIISRLEARPKRWLITIKRYTAAFACLAVVLLGVFAIQRFTQHGVTPISDNNPSFLQPDTSMPAKDTLHKYSRLSLDEARTDIDFGSYIPMEIPVGFELEDALRVINQEQDALFINWTKGMGYIDWRISRLDDNDKSRITSAADTQNYDLALYPIPRADSVPRELREIVNNPIFFIDELTLDVVQARTYEVSDSGDEQGPRMRFSVLYEDILVELSAKGVSPEVMFDMLQQIMPSR